MLNQKWVYLSIILEMYDRKAVMYQISKFNNNKLVVDTLREALSKRKDVDVLTIYSDQGFQYKSFAYKSIYKFKC